MKIVRVRGLKEYRIKGKLYRYHRLSNTPIDAGLSGAALAAEVDRLDRLHKPLQPKAGTLRLLIVKYKENSQHWKRLRDRTREDYERVFSWLGAAMDKPLIGYTTPVIVGLRDKAFKSKGYKFANQMLVTLDMVFRYGVEYDECKVNPVRDVSRALRPDDMPDANRPWEPQEAVVALEALPIHVMAPMAVAAFLGPREGDIVAMSKGAYKDGLLIFTTSKTRRMLELPVVDDLAEILARYLAWRTELFKRRKQVDAALTLFVNSRGKPWTIDGFKTSFGKGRNKLLEAKRIDPGVTFHGARHTVATILADAGYEEAQYKHILGHGKETITEHYSRRAKRRPLLKAMAETVQKAYRESKGNVVQLDRSANENV